MLLRRLVAGRSGTAGYRTWGQWRRQGGYQDRTKRTTASLATTDEKKRSDEERSDGEDRTAMHGVVGQWRGERGYGGEYQQRGGATVNSSPSPCTRLSKEQPLSHHTPTKHRPNPWQSYVIQPLHAVKVVRTFLEQLCKATRSPQPQTGGPCRSLPCRSLNLDEGMGNPAQVAELT